MYELNEPIQPQAAVEPKSRTVSRAKVFWLTMVISIPTAVAIAVGLIFSFAAIGWNVPGPILGFICGFGTSQVVRIMLLRHFERKAKLADV